MILSFSLLFLLAANGSPRLLSDDGGKSLINTKPPELENVLWLTDTPISLEKLQGKIVLIRWWTTPQCPFCAPSISALNSLAREFGDRGLVVIGLYHHKSSGPLSKDFVAAQMKRLDVRFAVGIDQNWHNLERWWLQTGERAWTSVSFLLDREGIIRYIHPGGAYSAEPVNLFPNAQEDYHTLRSVLQKLLDRADNRN